YASYALTLGLTLAMGFVPTLLASQAPSKGAAPGPGPATGSAEPEKAAASASLQFPEGTATPSELCGACHQAIYREYAEGFGADLRYGEILYESADGKKTLGMPAQTSMPTLHAVAGTDPFPTHARAAEEEGRSCNVCHFPEPFEIPDMNKAEIQKPKGRPKALEAGGLTCASCHLTP